MRIVLQRSQQVEVTRVTSIVLAGTVRPVGVLDMPCDLLPRPPVVVPVAAFDLVGGGGRAPKKILGELSRRHGCWATIARTTARIISASSRTATTPIGPTTAATARSVDSA